MCITNKNVSLLKCQVFKLLPLPSRRPDLKRCSRSLYSSQF